MVNSCFELSFFLIVGGLLARSFVVRKEMLGKLSSRRPILFTALPSLQKSLSVHLAPHLPRAFNSPFSTSQVR